MADSFHILALWVSHTKQHSGIIQLQLSCTETVSANSRIRCPVTAMYVEPLLCKEQRNITWKANLIRRPVPSVTRGGLFTSTVVRSSFPKPHSPYAVTSVLQTMWWVTGRAGWRGGNVMDSDLGDTLFESRPDTAYPKFIVSSYSLSSQIPRKLHRLGHGHFLSNTLHYIIDLSAYHLHSNQWRGKIAN
jgi:hypothetical protein